MESIWFIFLTTLFSICATLKYLIQYYNTKKTKLPPGPFTIPILSDLQWLRRSFSDLEPILRNFISKYGPIFTLRLGYNKAIFVSSPNIAHQALIQNGALFADRPPAPETSKVISRNQHNILTASYGPIWRVLRRNLANQIIHPSKVKSHSPSRKWAMGILKERLKAGQPVRVFEHFQYSLFCLIVSMCFGEQLDEKKIKEIESAVTALSLGFNRLNILDFFPKLLGLILFWSRWRELYQMRSNLEKVILPLINARRDRQQKEMKELAFVAYVDTLLNLELPDEQGINRKLNEHQIVTLCVEFLNAGTDTTSTVLQWIMANLVKHPNIQMKLVDEIKGVVLEDNNNGEMIKEEDLEKMTYLKAVVLEGLRRHPPSHFAFPHAVTKDVCLDGYMIPKDAMVSFMLAGIGWDPNLWEDPMEFKPERFLNGGGGGGGEDVFDMTGSKEIKMMPFGVGRRMCPGVNLAMINLEYFVANLVMEFEWTAGIGDDLVDLSEKQELMVVMKNPLCAHISPRIN